MRSRDSDSNPSERWFFNDRPIQGAGQDRLNHHSVAKVLRNAIESAEPPCMIGLLAEFGKGKSSTTNIVAEMLRDAGEYDVVSVTAAKHSGNERARNLVHGIAAELEQLDKIKPTDTAEILRPLRQATEVQAADPAYAPWRRLMSGRYSKKQLVISLLPFALVSLALAVLALLANGAIASVLFGGSGLAVTLWLLLLSLIGPDGPLLALTTPAKVTDQLPRAEAADEIEVVFGNLIGHHRKKRDRRLVIIVDDIDRLSSDDLLDALRVLRSLQSVPRGQEPVFVISCNEHILTTAVAEARSTPAPLPPVTDSAVVNGQSPESATQQRFEERDRRDESHSDPAPAFIDKLLTARVRMPSAIRGDMRRFAQDLVDDTHPLRDDPRISLEDLSAVLIHDAVEDPRSVVRLLNSFVGAYLLGCFREEQGTVFRGDITHHPDVVAQLCVLVDEFASFHAEVLADPVLLVAARKVALHQTALSLSETAAVDASSVFTRSDDSHFVFVDPELRHYLSSTARRVRYPEDISTLVYMAATPAGRTLGQQMHSELRRGLASGDYELLADVIARVPADRTAAAGQELDHMLREAAPVDASTYVAAVAPNLRDFDDATAHELADSCVDLLDRTTDPAMQVPANCLTEILDYAASENDEALCKRLLDHGEDSAETNERHAHAAMYLSGNPRVRRHLERRLIDWLLALPGEGSWDLGGEWLDAAESLDLQDYKDLRRAVVTAMSTCIRSEQGFTEQDSEHLVALADETVRGYTDAAPSSSVLVQPGPNTRAAFVHLWEITGCDGDVGNCEFAAVTAADTAVPGPARRVALERVVAWTPVWKSGERLDDDSDDEAEPYSVRYPIIECLVQAAGDSDLLPVISNGLPMMVGALVGDEIVGSLLDGVVSVAKEMLEGSRADEARHALCKVIEAAGCDQDLLDDWAQLLLGPITSENDPADPEVSMALRLVSEVALADHGEEVLASIATEWRDELRQGGYHDGRALTEGFKALQESFHEIVAENAEPILQDLHNRIQGQDDPANRLRTVATFPWPPWLQTDAVSVIDSNWDELADETELHAFDLFTRAEPDEGTKARYHDRLISATEANPYSSSTRIAASESPHMSTQRQTALFVAAVGKHPDVTQRWIAAEELEVARAIATGAEDADTVSRLLDALPQENRTVMSMASLAQIAAIPNVSAEVVSAVSEYGHPQAFEVPVRAALVELERDASALVSALRVLYFAKESGADVETRKITAAAIAHLPEASPVAGTLFGQLIRVRSLSRRLQDVLRGMRDGSQQARATAEAFRAARRGHRGR